MREVTRRLISNAALFAVTVASACATAGGHVVIQQGGVVVEERWEFLSFFEPFALEGPSSPVALPRDSDDLLVSRRLFRDGGCVVSIRRGRLSWGPQRNRESRCPVRPLDIGVQDVTRVGYARSTVEDYFPFVGSSRRTRHFLFIRSVDPSSMATVVRFYFDHEYADALLQSLSRTAGVAIATTAAAAARLPRDLSVEISADPLELLASGVPHWDVRRFPVLGDTDDFLLSPDGRSAVANRRLWDVSTGRELRRLPPNGGRDLVRFSPDGRRLLVGRNSGAINGDRVQQAGTVAIVDATSAARPVEVAGLPWIDQLEVSLDGRHAVAVRRHLPIGTLAPAWNETAVTAVALDRAEIVWQAFLLSGQDVPPLQGLEVGTTTLVAFGEDWLEALRLSTGERTYGPLRTGELSVTGRLRIWDVALADDRLSLVVWSSSPFLCEVLAIDATQGRVLSGPSPCDASTFPFSLPGWSGRVGMDTALPEGLGSHVVIWDFGKSERPLPKAEPVGQCRLDGRDARLALGGRAVVAAGDREIFVCTDPGGRYTP